MFLVRLFRSHQKFLFAIASIAFVVGGTMLALKWAQGYRLSLRKGAPTLSGTGLLVAESEPKGAQVLVNGKLTTATDDTLNLPPSPYTIEIRKDGFTSWKKTLDIREGLVIQTATRLFPSVPNLSPLTFTGASDPLPSPDGQKIAYTVRGASTDAKNGIWTVDLADKNLPVARASAPKQIARNSSQYNFLQANLVWTPDSNQVLAYWTKNDREGVAQAGSPPSARSESLSKDVGRGAATRQDPGSQNATRLITQAVLLSASGMNDEAEIRDATSRLPVLVAGWHQDLDLSDKDRLKRLPSFIQEIATQSAAAAYFSPNEFKLLYVATTNLSIPGHLIPDIPSESTQQEERDVKVNGMYVYDIKEDKNYKVGELASQPQTTDNKAQKPASSSKKPASSGTTTRSQVAPGTSSYWQERLIRNTMIVTSTESSLPATLPPVPLELLLESLARLQDRYSPIFELPVQWFPTSHHLLKHENNRVSIMEYDGTNDATVYAGPFDDSFVYPWPNGNRVVLLTTLNEEAPVNLYTISLE